MTALFIQIEPADDPVFVWLRTSASPNPERKSAMLVARCSGGGGCNKPPDGFRPLQGAASYRARG